jgi:CO dehydrogenase maturation factor
MAFKIAISGKGGVGKTSISGLMVLRLIAHRCKPVLAVDADPNTSLDAVLGVKAESTIGRVREQAREAAGQGMSSGLSKQELLEMKLAESLVEANNFDLIAMGRPEGPGCYCYANNVLKQALGQISGQYPYIVMDNEAGLENLSRRIVQRVELLVLVTDPSARGLETVVRLHELAKEMDIRYDKLAVIVNRIRNGKLPDAALNLKDRLGAEVILGLPDDEEIAGFAEANKPFAELSKSNAVLQKIDEFIEQVVIKQ